MADTDWTAIKTEYVTSSISYKKLAEKHGETENAVESRGRKEKWAEARRKYRAKVQKKALSRAEKLDVKRLASLQNAGTKMCNELERLMKKGEKELHTHVTAFGEKVVSEAVNDRKLLNIARAIDTMSRAMRSLYDIQTAAEKQQMQIAREEMDLKRRAQDAKEKTEDVQEITVTYKGTEGAMDGYHD